MESNTETNTVDTNTNVDTSVDTNTNANETLTMTQDELNRKLQSETDRRVQQALQTAKAKWEIEFNEKLESEKQEAAKLAKMTAEQRERAKFEKEKAQFEKEKADMARMKLENETIKQLSAEKLPTEFAKYVVGDDAESTLNNINEFKEMWQSAIENEIQSKLTKKQIPGSGNKANSIMTKEQFNALGYKERIELLNTNPELYNQLRN